MMWVVRAGKNALHYEKYIQNSRVYIPWDGYKINLSDIRTREDFRALVENEKNTDNSTTVSNWAGQLYTFVHVIEKGDFVLIPSKGSHTYCLGKIIGDYCFNINEKDKLYHHRDIKILEMDIPRNAFSQQVIYSLGAFRTIFRAKRENEIIEIIRRRKEERR